MNEEQIKADRELLGQWDSFYAKHDIGRIALPLAEDLRAAQDRISRMEERERIVSEAMKIIEDEYSTYQLESAKKRLTLLLSPQSNG